MRPPIRIANCSGFYGDRLAAAQEMVDGGPINCLTGDWLAELTMFILARLRRSRPGGGFARTFVTQMEEVMGTCLDRSITVVSNAGGLDPVGCAEAVAEVAGRLGLAPTIAVVNGDDVVDRLDDLLSVDSFRHLDTGEPLRHRRDSVVAANAYLGAWGIVEALEAGANIVITGRVTDASLAVGPAAHHHGWRRTEWDRLAGAVVAGHVIECGTQATGGNYSFFTEIADPLHPGFPIAEIAADGSSVITKHDGTGGEVSVGTVTSQLLYEVDGPRYLNPDVVARLDSVQLTQVGPDRVAIHGVRGEPAPATVKVGLTLHGGYRNGFSVCLTGLDIEEKARLVDRQLWAALPDGRDTFASVTTELIRTDQPDPASNDAATAFYRVTVKDNDEARVGRLFSRIPIELALASIPGFYGVRPPGEAQAFGVFWPVALPSSLIPTEVVVGGRSVVVAPTPPGPSAGAGPAPPGWAPPPSATSFSAGDPVVAAPLGHVVGARSGDKAGKVNIGFFARSPAVYAWLEWYLDTERFRRLLGSEIRQLPVHRYRLENLMAINFVIDGFLGEGVSASTRSDPHGKSLAEYLRAKVVDIPRRLLDEHQVGSLARSTNNTVIERSKV